MGLAALVFGAPEWIWPAVIFISAGFLLLFYNYRRSTLTPGIRSLCFGLKGTGILLLALCLLEPLWSASRAVPGANVFAIVADNSQGLQIRDKGESRSRGAILSGILTNEPSAWQKKIEETFSVRRYSFDSKLASVRDFSELNYQGRSSAMASALRQLAERFRGQPLAGVLIFTDGNATDWNEAVLAMEGLPPIYPVVMGEEDPLQDLALTQLSVNQTAFEDAPVTLAADVRASGFSKTNVTLKIAEVRTTSTHSPASTNAPAVMGRPVQEQAQSIPANSSAKFRFELRPPPRGVTYYQIEAPAAPGEATEMNNSRLVAVDRGQGPYRILYVSGRPNWEYKFLQRALQEDDQLELVALIRIANREPKFEFRSRRGETSNPLFRGFDKTDEATERYDQPVLIRLNTRDNEELRGGFPKSEEELFEYSGIIIDDLESEFFTREQMALLQKFVSERGGGFLMLGGQESFHRGKYGRTLIGDMLPIYLDRVATNRPGMGWQLVLTREGWLQPWARLRPTEEQEKVRLQQMPGFQVLNPAGGVKPGASVIASVQSRGSTLHPALVVQRFGFGRTAALLVGDLWRWGLQDEVSQKDLAKAWRQMARWLVADVPQALSMEIRPGEEQGEALQIVVKARDKKFQPLDNATVQIRVSHIPPLSSGTNSNAAIPEIKLAAEPLPKEPGTYSALFIPREPGGYLAEAVITDLSGKPAGTVSTGWTANPAAAEFESLTPNIPLLRHLAERTGGEVISASRLEAFAKDLPRRNAPMTESFTFPLWHQSWVFLIALACFVAEWGLRRWKGLA